MNNWIQNSLKLASSRGYLDKLLNVYPVDTTIKRQISPKVKKTIINALKSNDKKELISTLLRLDRFPIDDPYIGFIRKDKNALDYNPKTLERINKRLHMLGIHDILDGISRPESSSRKMGQMFKKWLYDLGYPVLNADQILKTKATVAILAGGDKSLKAFAKKELGYKGDKGLDLVIKVGEKFIIGEAKFISTTGGTQDKSFREGINFIKHKSGKALRIAVLDGVIWIRSKQKKKTINLNLYESADKLNSNQIVLSALLLKDFIEELIGKE